MGRKRVNRVDYHLDTRGIKELPFSEIKAILRGADHLIGRGGRNLLAKLLKGSRDKKVLELGLDDSPVYGYFKELTIKDITAKIDWLIVHDYLDIYYDYRLPLLVYTEKGWEIEKDTYSDELFEKLKKWAKDRSFDRVIELKDRNRQLILLLLDKIKSRGDSRLIPILRAWQAIEYKKVRKAINDVILSLTEKNKTSEPNKERKVIDFLSIKRGKICH
jgi:superfamily II DNA helicase RecQ